jgi:hypothetical protein
MGNRSWRGMLLPHEEIRSAQITFTAERSNRLPATRLFGNRPSPLRPRFFSAFGHVATLQCDMIFCKMGFVYRSRFASSTGLWVHTLREAFCSPSHTIVLCGGSPYQPRYGCKNSSTTTLLSCSPSEASFARCMVHCKSRPPLS